MVQKSVNVCHNHHVQLLMIVNLEKAMTATTMTTTSSITQQQQQKH